MSQQQDGKYKLIDFKVKSCSKETVATKASNICDPDTRSNWSTNTNAKEWIILEL